MMMKLGGRCIVQKSRPSSNLGFTAPLGAHPQNVALGYDVEKISAGCLVEDKVESRPLPFRIERKGSSLLIHRGRG